MTSLTARIEEIKKRLEEASPLSMWKKNTWCGNYDDTWTATGPVHKQSRKYGGEIQPDSEAAAQAELDSELVAHSPTDLAFLLSALETAVGGLEEAADALANALDDLENCRENSCLPTKSEIASCQSYLGHAREALAQIEAAAKGE
jgi:hypothetical protein